jgi:hypothetical protein
MSLSSFALIGERISQQAIAQLIGDPRYTCVRGPIKKWTRISQLQSKRGDETTSALHNREIVLGL